MTTRAPRVGLVGARRSRQGLGPFVARELAASGARVPAFLVTSRETLREAERALARAGQPARGTLDLRSLLADQPLDALAICSPSESHEGYLEAALEAGLHVLCDKPLLWGEPGRDTAAERLVRGFEQAGLLLRESCQWPYTLEAFDRLHPGLRSGAPELFEMEMQPANPGIERLADSLPHALSLLQALVPGARRHVEELRFEEGRVLRIDFRLRSERAATRVRVSLERIAAGARRSAGFRLDGRLARREIRGPDYALFFSDGSGRSVPVPDPLGRLVADFVRDLRAPETAPRLAAETIERARLLESMAAAYRSDPSLA